MDVHRSIRWSAVTLTVLGLTLMLLPTSSLSADGVEYFMGGGSSLTPQGAIQTATWDAEGCANSSGFYTCTVVGEPEIFVRQHPYWGTQYSAQVTVGCTR